MCIAGSVGRGGRNGRDDVRTVQLLLNANAARFELSPPLDADGVCGAGTVAAIAAFQARVGAGGDHTGVVSADAGDGGGTLRTLRDGLGDGCTAVKVECICIHAPAATVTRFYEPLLAAMSAAEINTPLRQAHFIAQLAHESGEFRYTEELASGKAYEGRKDLGNTERGDGPRFKGRGLIQLTGRANYAKFGASVGRDLCSGEACELVATDASLAVEAATWFWTVHGLNALADKDDVRAITERINGGVNGLADREEKLRRAKWFLLPVTGRGNAGVVRAMQAFAERRPRRKRKRKH